MILVLMISLKIIISQCNLIIHNYIISIKEMTIVKVRMNHFVLFNIVYVLPKTTYCRGFPVIDGVNSGRFSIFRILSTFGTYAFLLGKILPLVSCQDSILNKLVKKRMFCFQIKLG